MMETLVAGALRVNCYIIPLAGGRALVVDPGGDAERIVERLDALKLTLEAVVLTHGHLDHCAGLPALLRLLAGRGVRPSIIIHRADAYFLGADSYAAHCGTFTAAAGSAAFVDALWEELPTATRLVDDGDRVEHFTVLHTPGHTRGSICLYDEAGAALISGDTLFCGGLGRVDLPESSALDIAASAAKLSALPPETTVYPGHGGSTTIERERRYYGA